MAERVRAILHLDLDAFFAAVEILDNPALEGKPVLVGGRPEERGVVAAASYPARAFGVRSAMAMSRALRLCPEAIVLPGRHGRYAEYSRRVMGILHRASPVVEQMSIDEAFLDLTDEVAEWEEAVSIAGSLQKQVRDETRLSASLGVATNKLVAKVASDHDKPGGLTVVRPGEEAAFLAELPVRVLSGVGPVTARKLAEMGVSTVGELAQMPGAALRSCFGRYGAEMARRACGIDTRPVCEEHGRDSVSQERTFVRDLRDARSLRRELWQLSQGVARRLQRIEMAAGTVAIKLRYGDFTTISRQMRLEVPTDDERVIYRAAQVLVSKAWERGRPVRLLGVAGRQLSVPGRQLSLF